MKKLLLSLFIIGSIVFACKKKENDPSPSGGIKPCTYVTYKTYRSFTNNTGIDLYVEMFSSNGSKYVTGKSPFPSESGMTSTSTPTNCSYYRDSIGFVFYNADSSFVRVIGSYCPRNDSVYYVVE